MASMKLTRSFIDFFESEKSASVVLIFCTIISLALANSAFQQQYLGFWNLPVGGHGINHWVNDGLMAVFFLLIGLELEREVYIGELSSVKNAMLPVVAAIGGMVVPASIHLMLNHGTATQSGAGIPMATDIAFAIGVLSLLGNRVPSSLKVFLTALAVIDDLGAIIVIALFYSSGISFLNLGIAFSIFALLLILNRLKVYRMLPYLIGGVIMWYFMLQSGVHATITGVMLAFAIPFGKGEETSISYKLQHALHKPVSFLILPLFALANTCIVIASGWTQDLTTTNSLGIFFGLVFGKPVGIFLFSFIASVAGLGSLSADVRWRHLIGAGFLGGIGFTMSIFITLLAFDDLHAIDGAKIAILISSFVAGILGFLWLDIGLKKPAEISRI
jgi:NhaA family Na+:H+ antiporter